MTKIEMATYIAKEFLKRDLGVVAVRKGGHSLEAVIEFEGGEEITVTGKFAHDLNVAEGEDHA